MNYIYFICFLVNITWSKKLTEPMTSEYAESAITENNSKLFTESSYTASGKYCRVVQSDLEGKHANATEYLAKMKSWLDDELKGTGETYCFLTISTDIYKLVNYTITEEDNLRRYEKNYVGPYIYMKFEMRDTNNQFECSAFIFNQYFAFTKTGGVVYRNVSGCWDYMLSNQQFALGVLVCFILILGGVLAVMCYVGLERRKEENERKRRSDDENHEINSSSRYGYHYHPYKGISYTPSRHSPYNR